MKVMLKKPSYVLLPLLVAAAFAFIFTQTTYAAVCTFNGPGVWGKSPAVVSLNENIAYTLSGNQECANKNVVIEMYGKGGVDFRVGTLVVKAGSTGNVAVTTFFKASDFSGRSGDQTAYFKVKTEDGTSNQVTSPNLTVKLTAGGCGTPGQPACALPGSNGAQITNFDITPKQIAVGTQGMMSFAYKFSVSDPNALKTFCGSSVGFVWNIDLELQGKTQTLRTGANLLPTAPKDYSFDLQEPFQGQSDGVVNFTGVVKCGVKEVARSASVPLTIGAGTSTYSCNSNNQCVADSKGTYPDSTCDYKCIGATQDKTYSFNITNPLAGGPNDLFDIIDIVTKWIMYISIPLAVLWIMYAGFLMLTAGPTPANFQKGRDILKFTILGLAIIFIGKGFVSLIISVIELGGDSPTTQQPSGGTGGTGGTSGGGGGLSCVNGQWSDGSGVCSAKCLSGVCQNGFSPAGWNSATNGLYVCAKDSDCVAHKAIGGLCAKTGDCNSGLKCQNTMCIRDTGNFVGEPCLNGTSCNQAVGYACDNTNQASQTIDGRLVGSCYDIKNPNP